MKPLITIVFLHITLLNAMAQNIIQYDFEARMDGVTTVWTGDTLKFWGFRDLSDSSTTKAVLPGPTIYCELGDSVIINMTNPSFEAHTIHLHGLDVDQANDGVPSTSFFVQPGQLGTYSFKATQAGNYLYHCHVGTVLHLQMGMYGAVIVRPANGAKEIYPGGPAYDRDFEWLSIEVDKAWHDDYTLIGSFTNYNPNYFQINGKSRHEIFSNDSISIYNSFVGEKILLRIMNVGYGINKYNFPQGLKVEQFTSDGRVLANTVESDTLRVYPGERFGVLIEPLTLMSDSIKVEYLSMYKDKLWGTEYIPIEVNNLSGLEMGAKGKTYVYPNPVLDKLIFSHVSAGLYEIRNIQGEIKLKGAYEKEEQVSLYSLPTGVYIIQLLDNELGQISKKLIKI